MDRPLVRPPTRSLLFLTTVRLLINTGTRFLFPFLPAIARGLEVSLSQAGLLISARSLAGLATPLAVRAAGAGEQRLRLIGGGMLLFGGGAAVTAATGAYAGALFGLVLMGLAKPLYDVGTQAYLADRSSYAVRARYLTITELTWSGAMLVGAPAAGWMIAAYGWQAPFWALGGLTLAALAVLGVAIEPETPQGRTVSAPLRLTRAARALLAVLLLFTFGADLVFVVFGAWLENSFGLSLLALGGASALVAAVELAGEGVVLAFADRLGKRRTVAAALVVATAGFAVLPLTAHLLVPGLAVFALAIFGFEITIVSAVPLATEVAPAARSRFLALGMVAFAVGRAAAAAAGPPLFQWWGVGANALVASAVNLAALVVLLLWVREG